MGLGAWGMRHGAWGMQVQCRGVRAPRRRLAEWAPDLKTIRTNPRSERRNTTPRVMIFWRWIYIRSRAVPLFRPPTTPSPRSLTQPRYAILIFDEEAVVSAGASAGEVARFVFSRPVHYWWHRTVMRKHVWTFHYKRWTRLVLILQTGRTQPDGWTPLQNKKTFHK